MATTYSTELNSLLNAVPTEFADGSVHGGAVRRYRATIALASQASGDDIVIARVPDKAVFAYGVLNTDTTLGASTVAIGTDADIDLYRSAATFTATNAPTMFGRNLGLQEGPVSAQTEIKLTIAAANLPASGNLFVDLYFSQS